MELERARRWKEAMEVNRDFHFLIYNACGNAVLIRQIENLWLLTGPMVASHYLADTQIASDVHRQIIEALGRRVPTEAGDLIVQDMRQAAAVIVDHLRSQEAKRAARG